MADLNEREKHIITERRLAEDPTTLEDLAKVYNISREQCGRSKSVPSRSCSRKWSPWRNSGCPWQSLRRPM